PASALDIDQGVGVDQDIGDRRILEQRLQWPQAEDLVDDVLDELVELLDLKEALFLRQQAANRNADLLAQDIARGLVEQAEIQQLQQPLVDTDLQIGVFIDGRDLARQKA